MKLFQFQGQTSTITGNNEKALRNSQMVISGVSNIYIHCQAMESCEHSIFKAYPTHSSTVRCEQYQSCSYLDVDSIRGMPWGPPGVMTRIECLSKNSCDFTKLTCPVNDYDQQLFSPLSPSPLPLCVVSTLYSTVLQRTSM